MKIITRIFPNGGYAITSGWGNREFYYQGKLVRDFHNGIDYGTSGKKLPQYAVEDGYIINCGKASDGANYVWVAYPRIGKKFLHYHLDSISVSKGQSVNHSTILGYTGTTGQSTGIHLHLGMKDINGNTYQNAEEYNYQEVPAKSIDVIAQEVISGKWGNGADRKTKLQNAGYNYSEVQARVNELLANKSSKKYLNLKPNVSSWTVYKTNKYFQPLRLTDVKGKLNPKKFGGLSYEIIEDCGNYHFKIKSPTFGIVYIAGNPYKYDCTITGTPTYK